MSVLLLLFGVAVIGLWMLRPSPRREVVYIPIALTTAPRRLGCLPIIIVSILVILALGLIRW